MHHGAGTDYTAAYKVSVFLSLALIQISPRSTKTQRYTIYRKMPMLARQERTLAIDGVYVHVGLAG